MNGDPLPEPIGTGPARYDLVELRAILDRADLDLSTHDAREAGHRLYDLAARAEALGGRLLRTASTDGMAAAARGHGWSTQRGDHRPGR